MNTLYLAALALVLVPTLYMYTANAIRSSFPTIRGKRICLLIAHPDDEAMFFAPTVLALTRPELGNHVRILCLSTGDADGLGETRKRELVKSGLLLGLKGEDDVYVVDNPTDFPDSMTTTWDEAKIVDLLNTALAPEANDRNVDKPPQTNADVLLTFDGQGVSSHPNHISLYHGARAFVAGLVKGRPGWKSPVDLYTLTSVNMVRKYSSILDVFATITMQAFRGIRGGKERPASLVFASQLFGSKGACYATGRKAMTEAHVSQMRWFRHGWISLSRYMVVNDLRLDNDKER
ncbi:N-acetylglucosaminyl-phosphatidylinositol de-N-acetylase [Emericellopsis atlantica]|uniref:N-acetylglucosaminylphosphatidylinositol deacetylase n=1 Tax=Emericellopsis atlantica TaxID=2614577 RepID=A0A9P7ZI88_9HYPO|nr:N-acetylglucosaminyl-phosphatidylinositol de-N-acetylase [Emericellopsis atlantica]KAG9252623.1 N-acetylglucosaminyl-phosphatidylinositol de-N-acetylase [Emericellopsis atlantica]